MIGTSRERAIFFVFALAVASALRLALGWSGDELGGEVFGTGWKFGYGQLTTLTSLLASAWLIKSGKSRLAAITLPFLSAALALLLNARNLTGLTVLAGLAGALTAGRRRPLSSRHILAIGVTTALAGVVVVNIYQYTASEGLLGEDAQSKYQQQFQGNLNILQAGRSESLASTQAIIDSPIIGHGSWAHGMDYVMLRLSKLEEAGVDVIWQIDSDLIPSHSHLLGAWVEHGLLGAAFWAWAMFIAAKGVLGAIQRPGPLTGFVVFIGLSLLWDIPFSPFGLERRTVTAAWLYLMIIYAEGAIAIPGQTIIRKTVFQRPNRKATT